MGYGVFYVGAMAHFGKTLKRLRDGKHLSRSELAQAAGVTERQVYTWENSANASMQQANYRALATALGLTPEALDHEWRATKIEQSVGDPIRRWIPLINKAPAGNIVDYSECSTVDSGQGHWYIPREGIDDPHAFAVCVIGDSMKPKLQAGDYAIFSPMDMDGHILHKRVKVAEGHVVYIRFGPEAPAEGCTIGRVFAKNGKLKIAKDNKDYKPIICEPSHIVGMAALIRIVRDEIPNATPLAHGREQLDSKGEGGTQREGQIHPDDGTQPAPEE